MGGSRPMSSARNKATALRVYLRLSMPQAQVLRDALAAMPTAVGTVQRHDAAMTLDILDQAILHPVRESTFTGKVRRG